MAKAKAQRKSRRGTGRPHYAPEVKAQAIALATSYGNAERAARELGLPPQTVRRWLATPNEQTRAIVRQINESVAERLTESMMEAHDEVMRLMRGGELKPRDTLIAFGILADKALAFTEAERRKGPEGDTSELDKVAEALALVN